MSERLQEGYRGLHPAGRLGVWGGIAIVLIVAVYAARYEPWQEGRVDPRELPDISVVATSDQVNTLRLTGAAGAGAELTEEYRPAAEGIRSRVTQRLGEFRARYKPQWPTITVEVGTGDEAARQVAETLVRMLARFGLNGPVEARDRGQPPAAQPLVLWWPAGDMPVAYALLSAIAPYIQSEVAVIKDPGLSANRARLRIGGRAYFTGDGAVMLGRAR